MCINIKYLLHMNEYNLNGQLNELHALRDIIKDKIIELEELSNILFI